MIQNQRPAIFLQFMVLSLMVGWIISCSQKEVSSDPEYSPPTSEESTEILTAQALPEIKDNQTSYQARQTARENSNEFYTLKKEIRDEINPETKFSLGLDRMVRDDFSDLDHKRICVVTSRLAYDQNGQHLLETLLPLSRPIVTRVILFKDELPTPARSTDIDHILASHPRVRIFERNHASISLSSSMLDDTDIVLIDLPYRGSRFFSESAFMAEVLSKASERNLKVVLLDRPIPMSANLVDGPVGDARFHSSVDSYFPTYVVPGFTLGELAIHYNGYFGVTADLEVISMSQWNRIDGYKSLTKEYDLMEIELPEEISEWNQYATDNFRFSEFQIVKKMLPDDSVVDITNENGNSELVLNTRNTSADEFLKLLNQYEPDRYIFEKISDSSVSVSSEFPILPASLSLSIWAAYAKQDKSILPDTESTQTYGFGTMNWAIWLKEDRDPREIKRLWTQIPLSEELKLSRTKDLLYE